MRKLLYLISLVAVSLPSICTATNWYVDPNATGSKNGTSWGNAWTSLSSVSSSVQPGDTVYISGGSTSQTYNISSWTPRNGTSAGRITYQTGQDAGHNGTVIFQGGTNWIATAIQYVTISGVVNNDGQFHMVVQGYSDFVWLTTSGTVNQVTLRKIKFPSAIAGIRFAGANTTGVELDSIELDKVYYGSNGWADDCIYGLAGNAYGTNSIHDSYISLTANSSDAAWGDDGLKWPSGLDFYRNHTKVNLVSTYPSANGAQHSDMFQMNGSYMRIYDNIFEDVGESIIYQDNFSEVDQITGIQVYNNLFVNSHKPGSDVSRGIDIQPESSGVGTSFTNVLIANNDFVDWTQGVFLVRFDQISSCSNCQITNNIAYNSGLGYATSTVPPVKQTDNYTGSGVTFASYSQYATSTNNLNLVSSDSNVIAKGASLATYFATDYSGNARPQSSAWDIGAYQYGSGNVAVTPPQNVQASAR